VDVVVVLLRRERIAEGQRRALRHKVELKHRRIEGGEACQRGEVRIAAATVLVRLVLRLVRPDSGRDISGAEYDARRDADDAAAAREAAGRDIGAAELHVGDRDARPCDVVGEVARRERTAEVLCGESGAGIGGPERPGAASKRQHRHE
jgi:hypothetical protein